MSTYEVDYDTIEFVDASGMIVSIPLPAIDPEYEPYIPVFQDWLKDMYNINETKVTRTPTNVDVGQNLLLSLMYVSNFVMFYETVTRH